MSNRYGPVRSLRTPFELRLRGYYEGFLKANGTG